MTSNILFKYPIDGSYTNGSFFDIRLNENKNLEIYLCKNFKNKAINNGILLSKEFINFILNLPIEGFLLDDCTNIKINEILYKISRFKIEKEDMIKINQIYGTENYSIFLPSAIYSTKVRHFLKNIKILYDFRDLGDALEDTIIEAIIYTTFDKIRKRLQCDPCDKNKNKCENKFENFNGVEVNLYSALAANFLTGFGNCNEDGCSVIKEEIDFISDLFNFKFKQPNTKDLSDILLKQIQNEKTINFKNGTFFKLIKFFFY
ncbi:MAG: hypothetical protein QM535_20140 [Limnohabitans sp.]|nr:hypothetical protein [Limnohabitans sp.]